LWALGGGGGGAGVSLGEDEGKGIRMLRDQLDQIASCDWPLTLEDPTLPIPNTLPIPRRIRRIEVSSVTGQQGHWSLPPRARTRTLPSDSRI
jgi:hypothetical protein